MTPSIRIAARLLALVSAAGCRDPSDHQGDPGGGPPEVPGAPLPPTRIYATIVSHNEEDTNDWCASLYSDRARYLQNVQWSREMAKMVVDESAAWDMQTDWQYIERLFAWETDEARIGMGGKNSLEFMSALDPRRIAIDPHAHEIRYNFADVASLIEAANVTPTAVAGGFIYSPPIDETWTRLADPLQGLANPEVTWQAEILWGGSTKHHTGADVRASGVWKPESADNFFGHDVAGPLTSIGGYLHDWAGLMELLDKLEAGELAENRMYTATVFFWQCRLGSGSVEMMRVEIEKVQSYVDNGELVWATLPEIARIFRDEYKEASVVLQPDRWSRGKNAP